MGFGMPIQQVAVPQIAKRRTNVPPVHPEGLLHLKRRGATVVHHG
jgi:hypothetical protein